MFDQETGNGEGSELFVLTPEEARELGLADYMSDRTAE
jgi:hypothetical protein